jgi:Domain of unknown function (DUF4376)
MNDMIAKMILDLQVVPLDMADHYWIVGGATDQVYSSKTNTYVPTADADYVAWLETGKVATAIEVEADIWPCQQDIKPAWLFNGTSFAQPTPDTFTPDQLTAYAKEQRWLNETGGITVNQVPVETDDRSKGLVSQQRLVAEKDPATFATVWQAVDNTEYQIDGATMIALADAVAKHVNDCFLQYADVSAGILDGSITKTSQVDAKLAQVDPGFLDLQRKRRHHGG